MGYTDAELASFLAKCRTANQAKEQSQAKAGSHKESATLSVPKPVSPEQMAQLECAIKERRADLEKGSWRASAEWLEENFEEFREPRKASPPSSESAKEAPTVEPQRLANAPESSENVQTTLPAPSPIPLASSFWQALLFGNPDSLVSSSDATRALQLVSGKLGVPIREPERVSTMRAGQLRKLLRDRFGPADAEQTTAALWRSAPSSPGTPQPNDDQTN
jgi:hypothetical protein